MGSREKRLPRVTRTRLRRYQHPEIVLCPSRLARERTNLARVGKTRDYGLYGESTNDTPGGRRSFMTVMKMAPPVLKDRAGFPAFREKVKVFLKYNGFESVLTSDPPVDVGSTKREVLLRRGVSPGVYERKLSLGVLFPGV